MSSAASIGVQARPTTFPADPEGYLTDVSEVGYAERMSGLGVETELAQLRVVPRAKDSINVTTEHVVIFLRPATALRSANLEDAIRQH